MVYLHRQYTLLPCHGKSWKQLSIKDKAKILLCVCVRKNTLLLVVYITVFVKLILPCVRDVFLCLKQMSINFPKYCKLSPPWQIHVISSNSNDLVNHSHLLCGSFSIQSKVCKVKSSSPPCLGEPRRNELRFTDWHNFEFKDNFPSLINSNK